jgi:hypothetical protein
MADLSSEADGAVAGMSGWRFRELAGERFGVALSHEQLGAYARYGLLIRRGDGRWGAEQLNRLAAVRELAAGAPSLARRAVLLHGRAFPVPPAGLRTAMLEVAGMITAAKRKMGYAHRAYAELSDWVSEQATGMRNPRRRPPPRREWGEALRWAELPLFQTRVDYAYFLTRLLTQVFDGAERAALERLPFEEVVTLLAIDDLADARASP